MTLVPKDGGFLKIRTLNNFAIDGTATQLYGAQVDIELLNTPIGDMVLGGRDLEAEPMDLETHSALNEPERPALPRPASALARASPKSRPRRC